MKTLNFELPEFGKTVGTTAWTTEKLEEISKTFKQSKRGKTNIPCLTYDLINSKGETKSFIF